MFYSARFLALLTLALPIVAQAPRKPSETGAMPPKTWVDKDTGHRVWRLTDEPGSSGFYFNFNAYTPDLKTMIYTAPDGIHGMDLATRQTRMIVPNPPRPEDGNSQQFRFGGVHAIIAGRVTNSVFYTHGRSLHHMSPRSTRRTYIPELGHQADRPSARDGGRHHQRRRNARSRHH